MKTRRRGVLRRLVPRLQAGHVISMVIVTDSGVELKKAARPGQGRPAEQKQRAN